MTTLDVDSKSKQQVNSAVSTASSKGSNRDRNADLMDRIKKVDELSSFLKSKQGSIGSDEITVEEENGDNSDTNFGFGGEAETYYNPYGYPTNTYEEYGQYMNEQDDVNDDDKDDLKDDLKDDITETPKETVTSEKTSDETKLFTENLLLEDFDSTNNLKSSENSVKTQIPNKPKYESPTNSENESMFSSMFSSMKGLFGSKKVDAIEGSRGQPVRTDAF